MKAARLLAGLLLLFGLGAAVVWWTGALLSAPHPMAVGPPPPWLPAEPVRIPSASGSRLSGWFAPGTAARGGVLLLHGSGADRRSMLGRARFLRRAGYGLLLIDFQGHGESPGCCMTSGHLEARDAEAALRWLRARLPGEPLGVIGFSLGGAAALLGEAAREADALVLEAVYADFATAVANRIELRLGPPGRLLTPLLLWQVRPRMGFDPQTLAPVERIAAVATPLLIVGGSEDGHATIAESRSLYAAATEPKELWIMEGAAHQDYHAHAPKPYERRILGFFHHHFGGVEARLTGTRPAGGKTYSTIKASAP
jgi:pimeloyl-ACP methyl ester carboxylesterase